MSKSGAPRKVDFTAMRAKKEEREPTEVTFDGETYFSISHPGSWPLEASAMLRGGDQMGYLKAGIGPDAFAAFMATDPDNDDAMLLIDALTGASPGES